MKAITACGIFHVAEAEAEEMAASLGKTIKMLLVVRHLEADKISQRNRV